jgi:hypothetical protein
VPKLAENTAVANFFGGRNEDRKRSNQRSGHEARSFEGRGSAGMQQVGSADRGGGEEAEATRLSPSLFGARLPCAKCSQVIDGVRLLRDTRFISAFIIVGEARAINIFTTCVLQEVELRL